MRKARILIVNDSLNVGGAERVAVDIANTLDRDTYQVTFCSTRHGGPLEERISPDVKLTILGRRATWDLVKMVEFARMVRAEGVDLIHSHGRGTTKFVALARALGLIDVPIVFHDHFGWLHIDRTASPGLRFALRREIDAYIGVDGRLCDWATNTVGLPADRVHLVRSGVDLGRFSGVEALDLHRAFDLPSGSIAVVMIANFRPQKDHPTLFQAIAALPTELAATMRLLIVGSTDADTAYFDGCRAMISRLGIDHLVHLAGPVNDVPSLLSGADAAVLSSKNETGPLAVLEYMASGLPFVATETGEIAHAVRDSGVGLLVEPRDYLALADALSDLLAMTPADRQAMGSRGRRLVEQQFEQNHAIREVEQIYRLLLSSSVESLAWVQGHAGSRGGAGRAMSPWTQSGVTQRGR